MKIEKRILKYAEESRIKLLESFEWVFFVFNVILFFRYRLLRSFFRRRIKTFTTRKKVATFFLNL